MATSKIASKVTAAVKKTKAASPPAVSTPAAVEVESQEPDIRELILRKLLTGDALTADEQKFVDVEVLGKLDPVEERWQGDEPRLYQWLIPGDRGYTLCIRIEEAVDAEDARQAALDYIVPTEDGEGRSLSGVERQWVTSMAPEVIRDTVEVTLGHAEALDANTMLRAQNAAYRATNKLFRTLGIDVFAPQDWVDRKIADAQAIVDEANDERDLRHRKMELALDKAQSAIDAARDEGGFRPPKPKPAVEPDYARLTVIVDNIEGAKAQYPRLAGANFIEHDLGAEFTDKEKAGWRLVFGEAGAVREWNRLKAGPAEQDQVDAIVQRVLATMGTHPELS